MKKTIPIIILLISVLFGCSNNIIKTASLKYKLKTTIPENTKSIELKITGEGLTSPIQKRMNNEEEINQSIKDLPLGEKSVELILLDENNKVLRRGTTKVIIVENKVSEVYLDTQEEKN
ncbi:MAG: hypothetical protein U0457_16195 [Candidatus Sericytochromatia bacterium]